MLAKFEFIRLLDSRSKHTNSIRMDGWISRFGRNKMPSSSSSSRLLAIFDFFVASQSKLPFSFHFFVFLPFFLFGYWLHNLDMEFATKKIQSLLIYSYIEFVKKLMYNILISTTTFKQQTIPPFNKLCVYQLHLSNFISLKNVTRSCEFS